MAILQNFADDSILVKKTKISQEEMAQKAKILIDDFERKTIEREEVVRLVVLSFMSSKHMFLIGKPGVGKTFMLEKLKYILKEGFCFEYLLMKDTKTSELFGRTREDSDGNIIHDRERSVVNANIIILDEMFKASAELLNGFLGIFSQNRNFFLERVGEVSVPLISGYAASNEFPQDDILAPFDDRFHFRYEVKRIENIDNFRRYITGDFDKSNDFGASFSYHELVALRDKFKKVYFPEDILDKYMDLKNNIIRQDLSVSDRKFSDATEIFKASAYLNNRQSVSYSDIFLLLHIGWKDFIERDRLKEVMFNTFFSKKDDMVKRFIDIKEGYSKLISMCETHVIPFISEKIIFNFEEVEECINYNNYVDFFIGRLEDFEYLKNSLFIIEENYNFTLFVEEDIRENIFLIDYVNETFSEEFLEEFFSFKEKFIEVHKYYFSFALDKGKKIKIDKELLGE